MLSRSICYSCKSPNDLFCKKSKIKLSCPSLLSSRHQLTVSLQNNWSRERPWNHLAPMSRGKVSAKRVTAWPPSWSQNRSCFPTIHFIQIQISSFYTSFECQVKCTSNLESVLLVTVYRIYYSTNPDCNYNF